VKFRVKKLYLSTGDLCVAVLNYLDARELTFHRGDRIRLKKGRKEAIAIIDTTNSEKVVARGYIGLMDESVKKLKISNGHIEVLPEPVPGSVELIRKKLDGKRLCYNEYVEIIHDILYNKLTPLEIAYFVSGIYVHRMGLDEIACLTRAIVNTGDIFKLDHEKIIDKHCIGGVPGNRTTMIVVPIIAAAGLYIPKTSSRAITSPAGTADTMEVLCKVSFSLQEMKKIVKKTNGCLVWGGSLNLAPADDKIISVEKPLSLDAESQLLASIMSKKKSVSATHIVIDIPYGKDAKVETRKKALHLKNMFQLLGRKLNIKTEVVLTDGSQPIGNGIGPLLEARDILYILTRNNKRPLDLEKKALIIAGKLLEIGGKAKKFYGIKLAKKILDSGKAYEKFHEIVREQDGLMLDPDKIKLAAHKFDVKASRNGKVVHIDNKFISKIAVMAGAPKDKKAGIYLYKHKKQRVRIDDILYTIYSESKDELNFVLRQIEGFNGFVIR